MVISVVAINGSPHKKGITSSLLTKFLSAAEKSGAKTALIHLADHQINPCNGCYSCSAESCKFPCVQKDGMQEIYPLLEQADVIVFGTPVYWFNMSGLMKNFMDRLCCLAAHGYILEGKVGLFIAASKENEGGRMNASLSMASAMNHLGLFIPPYGIMFYPGKEKVVKKGKVIWDDWVMQDLPKIAKNLVPLCKFLRKSKFEW
ncbi:MAG: flavodoxin family protein [Candidatus Woesearchaeota archaeon]